MSAGAYWDCPKDAIQFEQIVLNLPKPTELTSTARANSIKRFKVDLSSYNIF